jgi:hypothetical protein
VDPRKGMMMIHDELRPDQLENYALIERSFDPRRHPDMKVADQLVSQTSVVAKSPYDSFQVSSDYRAGNTETNAPRIVWVRISFENFGEVDTMNEKYTALVRVKCKWFFI